MSSAPFSRTISISSSSPMADCGTMDHPFAREHPGHAALLAQVAVVFAEDVAHLGNGAVLVVGHGLDQDGHAAGAVALVGEFLVIDPLQLAGAALDGFLDVVAGHVGRPRPVDGVAQARVGFGIAAAGMRAAMVDFPDEAGKQLAALGVGGRFLMLDRTPLGMSGHGYLLMLIFFDSLGQIGWLERLPGLGQHALQLPVAVLGIKMEEKQLLHPGGPGVGRGADTGLCPNPPQRAARIEVITVLILGIVDQDVGAAMKWTMTAPKPPGFPRRWRRPAVGPGG